MEKYDMSEPFNQAGGEYDVQEGFGWTNGVTQVFCDCLDKGSA
jgi:neutral trehalase